ncbi:DASH complex subunit Ask1-domain-containing protein [Amylocarpus encephaloides]|uniref:DASH complex subunit ASK1 n=1 Tax=Amylocarpus encephaloides TaxID=45428 RepID=A0A9P7YCX9_9HELO|nr:DASH complex subunit Ask1-domain-containing protein [Amylocarpus encephaloides]
MSRASTSSTRALSLTEELEKLEQSITLTLQGSSICCPKWITPTNRYLEIDHNFSRAHRIVTSSILPIVEQYGDHSNAVWEGSKFWKQFFEASANVSLSGVEEREEDQELSYAQSQQDASTYAESTSRPGDDTLHSRSEHTFDQTEDSLLDNADISGSTPRAPRPKSGLGESPRFAEFSSPYEDLKQELKGSSKAQDDDTQIEPTTPGAQSRIPNMSMTPESSPFDPTTYLQSQTKSRVNTDPLLHRVLDKNYRIQATPHTARKQDKTPLNKPSWKDDSSPMSSPPVAAPQLHFEIFDSPIRKQYNAPRTPGVSVQTPAKGKSREFFSKAAKKNEISWESDSEEDAEGVYRELGMSPPKTIQFNLPQSRLLQTPAREASKMIVQDLLATAGAGFDDSEEFSPTIVKMRDNLDDSF